MTEITPSIPRVDQRLVWLDGLSRAGATVIMLVLIFSVVRVGLPPAVSRATLSELSPPVNVAPLEIEKSWAWSRPARNFDSMYGSEIDR
jgi:hypothetical protein